MISLRLVGDQDRARLLEWRNKSEVRSWMYSSHVISSSEHDRWFDSISSDSTRLHWIVLQDEQPVGSVYLSNICLPDRSCSIGVYIGESESRGCGVARKAVSLALREAFMNKALEIVVADVLEVNEAAISLYQSLGMKNVGHVLDRSDSQAAYRYVLSRSDWEVNLGERKTEDD